MPLHRFPGNKGYQRNAVQRSGANASTTSHTSSATAHVYNTTWTQLVASTAFDATGFMIRLGSATSTSATRSDYIMQLGIGTAGSEQVVVEVPIGFKPIGTVISLPLWIPAGSRVAIRHKGQTASKALTYTFDYYGSMNMNDVAIPQKWVCYGKVDDASNSRGTQVTAGNSNAWGAWTAITTSTGSPHELWVPIIDGGTVATTTALSYRAQWAHASTTDAATMATNATLWEGMSWATTTAELMNDSFSGTLGNWIIGENLRAGAGLIYAPRAAGSPISMRALCSGTAEASVFGSILAAVM